MQKSKYLFLLCSMIAPTAYGDSFLCLAEQFTSVSGSPNRIEVPFSRPDNGKYIVEDNLLRRFENQQSSADNCRKDASGTVRCTYVSDTSESVFTISPNLVFSRVTRSHSSRLSGNHYVHVEMGICSLIK